MFTLHLIVHCIHSMYAQCELHKLNRIVAAQEDLFHFFTKTFSSLTSSSSKLTCCFFELSSATKDLACSMNIDLSLSEIQTMDHIHYFVNQLIEYLLHPTHFIHKCANLATPLPLNIFFEGPSGSSWA